ncbi:MAG: hypothetical protein DI529_08840 [Chryseobacterium sp.]|nr:MAG: hypothetical protein DI529_08840 [Chryseobacterium sp.]
MDLGSKKNLMFFFLLLTLSFTSAQAIEEEVTNKSCECISAKISDQGQISKAEIQKCISKSGDEVLKSKDPQEVKRITGNIQQFVERLKVIYKNVSEKCLPKQDN